MNPSLTEIFLAFARAGALGFGGGAALTPAMHREAVLKKGWVADEKFNDMLAVSNVLPGPSAIEVAVAIGWEQRGLSGALAAVSGLVLPFSLFSVVFVLLIFGYVHDLPNGMWWFHKATVGLFVFVAMMTLCLALRLFSSACDEGRWKPILAVAALTFILVDDNVWFGTQLPFRINNAFVILAMVGLVVLSETPWKRSTKLLFTLPMIAFLWSLSALFPVAWKDYELYVAGGLFALLAFMTFIEIRATAAAASDPATQENVSKPLGFWKKIAVEQISLWGIFLAFFGVCAALFAPLRAGIFLRFARNTIFASLITFGGGPVYIPIVIAMQSGSDAPIFLYPAQRMMEIIAVTNPIPSPIMTKLSAVAGYDIVNDLIYDTIPNNGVPLLETTTLLPWLVPWLGALLLVLVMTLPAITAMLFAWPAIERIKKSPSLRDTSLWIKPILAGVFVSVAVMFLETAWERFITPAPEGIGSPFVPSLVNIMLMGIVIFVGLQRKFIPDFYLMGIAVVWGLLFA